MKKTLLITAISVLALIVPSFASSQEVSKVDTSSLDLVQVDSIPKDITPIVINSQDDFNRFVETVASDNSLHTQTLENKSLQSDVLSSNLMKASLYSSNTTSKTETIGVGLYLNLYAKMDIYSSGSFGQINSVTGWTTLTGYSPGIEWVQNNVSTSISSDKQSANVSAHGTLKYYLLVDGVFNVWNEDKTISLYYHL